MIYMVKNDPCYEIKKEGETIVKVGNGWKIGAIIGNDYFAKDIPITTLTVILESDAGKGRAETEKKTSDAVQVVRCKDCKWCKDEWCLIRAEYMLDSDFCSDGERKSE